MQDIVVGLLAIIVGAVFCFRGYLALRIVIPIPLPIPALWMLGVWIAVQIVNVILGSQEPVAWWAHLGGVAAGALLAIPFKRREVPLFGGR